jgi:mannosyltransferase
MTAASAQVAEQTNVLRRRAAIWAERWKSFVPAACLTLVLAVLVSYALGRRNLANDEATSFFIAQLDFSRFWESLATSEANGSLFYTLLRAWMALGESEQVLRILPAAFAVATVPVLYLLCLRLFGRAEAFAASALLTTNAFFIAQGQDLRSYSLAALLVTASTLSFERLVRRPSRLAWSAYVVLAALSMYAHFFSAFVIAAHVASLPFLGRRVVTPRRWIAAYGAVGLLISPLVFFVLFNDVGQVDWISPTTWERFQGAVRDLFGMGDLLVLAYGLFCAVALVVTAYVVVKHGRSEESWKYVLVTFWLIVPIAGALAVSEFKPLFVSRYLLVAVPAGAVYAAVGITRLRSRLIYMAALLLVAVLAVPEISDWYEGPVGEGWAGKAKHVMAASRPGDAAVFYAPTIIRPFGYYAGYYTNEAPVDAPDPVYPSRGWLGYSATEYSPSYAAIARSVSQHDRVWFVTGYARDEPRQKELARMHATLTGICETADESSFTGTVKLFSGCARSK